MLERPIPRRAPSLLGALRFRDFRLLWFGLLVSNLGTWMQFTASSYLIVKLAGSPAAGSLYVGILGGARAIPVLLFSPLAGVLADTWPRRRLLFATNIAVSLLALLLAVLTTAGWITIWGLIAISMCNAAAQAFDTPARQSWVPLLVDREYIGNAIGLNSVAFNAPSVIGPVIAGFLILISIPVSFYVNAAATLAVVLALIFMKPVAPSSRAREPMLVAILGGIRFLLTHGVLRAVMVFFILSALLARPYTLLLPAYALNYLHTDAKGLGLALGAVGLGAFGGALVTAMFGSHENRGVFWIASAALTALGVMMLGLIKNLLIAMPLLVIIGLAVMTFMGMTNTLIQTLSGDEVRGRAIAVYSMVALGVVPLGAFLLGGLGAVAGLHVAFIVAGALTFVVLIWIVLNNPRLRTA
ncbi:MAG: hypothetical protein DLM50_04595 [Candidatus Meridianibacter frigidus]|nr:MAG: hypothetical protein DLM50_04595 [Candidatus Eremiobacteraeota bacterium]